MLRWTGSQQPEASRSRGLNYAMLRRSLSISCNKKKDRITSKPVSHCLISFRALGLPPHDQVSERYPHFAKVLIFISLGRNYDPRLKHSFRKEKIEVVFYLTSSNFTSEERNEKESNEKKENSSETIEPFYRRPDRAQKGDSACDSFEQAVKSVTIGCLFYILLKQQPMPACSVVNAWWLLASFLGSEYVLFAQGTE